MTTAATPGTVELREWRPDFGAGFVDGRIMMFIGRRGSGKTTAQRCALKLCQEILGERLEYGVCMTRTSSIQLDADRWDHFVPREFIIPHHSEAAIRDVMDRQRKKIEEVGRERAPFAFIISDDCADDLNHSPELTNLFYNGRHHKIIAFIVAQDAINLERKLRGQIDYTFLLRDNQIVNLNLLYENYSSAIPKDDMFALLRQLWRLHEVLVVDNSGEITMEPTDSLATFAPTLGVKFRAGSTRFWVTALVARIKIAAERARKRVEAGGARRSVRVGGRTFLLAR